MNIGKPLAVFLAVIMAVSLLLIRTETKTSDWTDDELNYALKIATQDATSVMMDSQYIFGIDNESEEFSVNLPLAYEQFKSSFFSNIGSTISATVVNEASVSLAGYAGYRHVAGIFADGQYAIPMSYTYYDDTTKLIYEFTLGDRIYTTNTATMAQGELDMAALPAHYFHPTIDNKDFKNITVMSTINRFLDLAYQSDANVAKMTAINHGTGVSFNLGLIDYASDDPSLLTTLSAVIDGPSFFAVVDCNDTKMQQVNRVLSIGAAELKLTVGG